MFGFFKKQIKKVSIPNEEMDVLKQTSPCVMELNRLIVSRLKEHISNYVIHQEEQGMYLPKEFETNPAAWLIVLGKIRFAFDQTYLKMNNLENPVTKNKNATQLSDIDKQIQEGFELFGKYLLDLKEIK